MIPDSHEDLLTRPLFAHLATVRPDGTPQVNPMWFDWDGTFIRFTNTTARRKYRNVSLNPAVAMSVNDPEQPYRYLEVRGRVVSIDPDEQARFFASLAARYGVPTDGPPGDAADRVILTVQPTAVSYQ